MHPVFGICIMFHNGFPDSPSEYEWNRKLESDKLTVHKRPQSHLCKKLLCSFDVFAFVGISF